MTRWRKTWRRLFHGVSRIPGIRKEWRKDWIGALAATCSDQHELQAVLGDTPSDGLFRLPAIGLLASRLGRTQTEVAWVLSRSLTRSAKRLTTSSSRHVPDLLIAAVLAALVGLPVLAQRREARAQAQTQEAATAALARPHLEAAHDLAPYVPLQAADVVARGDPIADAEALAANAVGHYPTSRIEKARPLDPSRLSKRRIAFAAFFLLRVTLKLKPAFDVSSFPVAVSLLLSARGGPAGVVLNGELLDLASDGVTAIVAIPEADVSDVARFLGEADVYLAVRVP